MAYVANGLDDENKNSVSVNGGGSTVHLAPSSGVGAVGAGAGTSNNGQGAGGGSFATINQYLNANQDQAQPLANQLTAGINQQYNTLSGQNDKTVADLNSAVNSGYTKQDNNVLAQEAANPTSFAQDANNVTNFQGQLNDKYTGPQSAEGADAFTKQQAALNSAISQGKSATQTEAGRQGLLTGVEKTQTPGVSALNSAILSSNPNSQSQIEHAYDPFSGLVSGLTASGQKIDENIAGATKEAANASGAANSQLQGQVTNLNQNIGTATKALQDQFNGYNTQAGQVQQQATGANSAIQGYLSNTPQVGAVDTSALNPYMNISQLTGSAPTAASSASSQDYATQAALQKLAGATPLNTAITQDTASQAGTALPQNFAKLQSTLNGFGDAENGVLNNISGGLGKAAAPVQQDINRGSELEKLATQWPTYQRLSSSITSDQKALTAAQNEPVQHGGTNAAQIKKDIADAQAKLAADQKAQSDFKSQYADLDWSNGTPLAGADQYNKGVANAINQNQWLPGAQTGFNSLLSTLGSSLAPVSPTSLPSAAQFTPNETSSNGLFGNNVLAAIANPLTTVPAQINLAKKEASKI